MLRSRLLVLIIPFFAVANVECGGVVGNGDSPAFDAGSNDAGQKTDTGTPTTDGSSPPRPTSCQSNMAGAGPNCSPSGQDNCCSSLPVPGGIFLRDYDGVTSKDSSHPATVSPYYLDKYEVTVGRFRNFVEAFPASKPPAGAGAHPGVAGSGWDASWPIAASSADLRQELEDPGACDNQTWTDAPGAGERKPMNCITWYEAFAFCAWDAGRLPSDIEWNFAAAGGNEQRVYPWSSPPSSTLIDTSHAIYTFGPTPVTSPADVGTASLGAGGFGQLDLGGNVNELLLDRFVDPLPAGSCVDCINLEPSSNTRRPARGGSWDGNDQDVYVDEASVVQDAQRFRWAGVRCARDE